jgi:hypothetical protein
MRRALAIVVSGALLLGPGTALADEAEDAFREGQEAESRLDLGKALAAYDRALALRPSASFALRARTRAEDLRGHSEGGFEPLVRLERVRRDPVAASDATALGELYEAARAFPPGRVRAESLMLVAEGFARRAHLPERAIAPAKAVALDPTLDRNTRALALGLLVDSYVAVGDVASARRIAVELRAVSPALARKVEREGRRVGLERAAEGGLGLMLLLGGGSAARVARRDGVGRVLRLMRAPVPPLVAVLISALGALLANAFDPSITSRPFVLLGAGVLLVDRSVVLLRASLGDGRVTRALVATGGLLAVLMAAILALAWSDPIFIESFGL